MQAPSAVKRPVARLMWLDMVKGIALLLVLLGHCFRDSMREVSAVCAFVYDFVYAFHVPAFFFVSGMCYALGRKRYRAMSLSEAVAARFRAYMRPWLSYSVLIYGLFFSARLIAPVARLLPSGYPAVAPLDYAVMMLKNENPYAFHLWYLYTVFLFSLFIWLVDRLRGERTFRWVLVLLMAASCVCYLTFARTMCWTVKSFFQQLMFFLAGVLVPPDFIMKKRSGLIATGCACAAGLTVMLLCPGIVPGEGPVGDVLDFSIRRVCVMGIILGLCAVCALLQSTELSCSLACLGKNSLAWYLYHQPLCCAVLGGFMYDTMGLPLALCVAACMAASLTVPALLLWLTRVMHLQGIFRRLGLPC